MHALRIGMIGTGGIAEWHAANLKELPEAKIVALADVSEYNRNHFAEKCGLGPVEKYSDHIEMLKRAELDAVVICSPHTLHFRQAMDALGHGCHVLMEKPMTCSLEEAEQLISAAEKAGKVLQVSYQRHCEPEFHYIKDAITGGEIGKLTSISASLFQDWKAGTTGTWRQNPALSGGGMLMDSGSHIIDVLLWVTGLTPSEIKTQLHYHDCPVEIDSFTSIRFAEGPIANLEVVGQTTISWLERYVFSGTEGSIVYECRNYHEKSIFVAKEPYTYVSPEIPAQTTNQDKSFVDAILGRCEVLIPGTFASKVVSLTERIYEAGGYRR